MFLHSHEFRLIPSERLPDGPKKREMLMLELAHRAWNEGNCYVGVRGDQRRRLRHQGRHAEVATDEFWRPGAFIERQPPEVRERLRNLKSEDIADVHLWSYFTEMMYPDEFPQKVGFGGKAATTPSTVWKVGGGNPDRSP